MLEEHLMCQLTITKWPWKNTFHESLFNGTM
jgi:hypothetical protein